MASGNTYKDYYPMDDCRGVQGAYTWLNGRGYGKIAKAIKQSQNFGGPKSLVYCRRRIIVGLLYHVNLDKTFLTTLWIQGDSPQWRRYKLDGWHEQFLKHPQWQRWLNHALSV